LLLQRRVFLKHIGKDLGLGLAFDIGQLGLGLLGRLVPTLHKGHAPGHIARRGGSLHPCILALGGCSPPEGSVEGFFLLALGGFKSLG
jgi:hypothetical protein